MTHDDRQQILALLREQEAANARADASGVIAPLANNLVTFDLPPPLANGYDETLFTAGLERWFATWEGPVTVELADPEVLVDGDLAVVFGLSRMRGQKKESGPVDAWNRRTVVLQRIDGRWRIVHEHSSYPMAMDGSGRALTDLEP